MHFNIDIAKLYRLRETHDGWLDLTVGESLSRVEL
jgi:hypothetical protein